MIHLEHAVFTHSNSIPLPQHHTNEGTHSLFALTPFSCVLQTMVISNTTYTSRAQV